MESLLPMTPLVRNRDELEPNEDGRVPLFGDPDAGMPYAFRFRVLPGDPGERPHHHAGFELGTVLEGEVWIAIGEPVHRASAVRVGTGGFLYVPPDVPHAMWTDAEALVEVHGVGPRGPGGFLDGEAAG